ncbi:MULTISPECIES: Nif3-like dinuclear metal center hexameric protein [unclassified Neptuniibacter]|uniref:Nif3-like dinuclear metal center hexameric protein n=1 Tax=unclassified Neptuniibacter TaxID=2630693 RepID=UPI000C4609FB|nr:MULTISPECIES: Nif3-like dinuclear metal center hexameric protein [unclassified Neptuniibacter]MAY42315.1 Nif3-like dinuclear metal center hexameric protein [Oceanospirillaceae bacterium]
MSIKLQEFVSYINTVLTPELFKDYCPNGLQVEGKQDIKKFVTGVTASQALIDAAIEQHADAILVHHGFFWKGEDSCITKTKKKRIKALLDHDISLIAYHLPLDAHPELGNNAQLAKKLGIKVFGGLEPENPRSIGNVGELEEAHTLAEFSTIIDLALGRYPLAIKGGDHKIKSVAWCTGGAQGYIDKAIDLGVDAYISGEISEPTVHTARENGIHYFSAGHHATERYGVQALGEKLALQFGLQHQFIEISNPV